MSQLKPDLLIDLAKLCLVSSESLEVIKPHLQYSFIDQEPMKHIFKYIFDFSSANKKSPTIGLLSQNVDAKGTLELIGKIREANVYDHRQELIENFQEFIKKARFRTLWKNTEELMNTGKGEQALVELEKESAEINAFSLKRQLHTRIFADHDRIISELQNSNIALSKIPTGIPQLDYHTRGGLELGTSFLGIGRSGAGKSTFLRTLGYNAAFRGFNVLHLSAEGKKKDLEQEYTAAWMGVDLNDFREGQLDAVDWKKIEKAKKAYLAECGEIYVEAFEQFNSVSIADCRKILIDVLKETQIHLVIFDYLEKFEPGNGKRYSTNDEGTRAQKLAVAEKITNIATEFNVVCATFTQASNIDKEKWNNVNWVISREHISNLKATIDPFAYCITINQTEDENDNEIARIHEEKFRKHKIFSYSSTYHIKQDRSKGRFIDIAETKRRFWDEENKKIIKHLAK